MLVSILHRRFHGRFSLLSGLVFGIGDFGSGFFRLAGQFDFLDGGVWDPHDNAILGLYGDIAVHDIEGKDGSADLASRIFRI